MDEKQIVKPKRGGKQRCNLCNKYGMQVVCTTVTCGKSYHFETCLGKPMTIADFHGQENWICPECISNDVQPKVKCCGRCGLPGIVVVCTNNDTEEKCEKRFHLACMIPPRTREWANNISFWFCPFCVEKQRKKLVCYIVLQYVHVNWFLKAVINYKYSLSYKK